MKMTWGIRRIKLLLYISNIILAIFGLCIIIFGGFGQLNSAQVVEDGTLLVASGTDVVIGLGSVIFIMALIGIWGVVWKNRCILFLYAIGLAVLIVIPIGVGIFATSFAREDNVVSLSLQTRYKTKFKMYKDDLQTAKSIDDLQDSFKCCGMDGPSDFSTYFNNIPGSCCGKPKGSGCHISESYKVGCFSVLNYVLVRASAFVASCAFLIATFYLVNTISAFVLADRIKKIQQADRVVGMENL